MAVIADNKRRLTLRLAKPGDRFDVQVSGQGECVLTEPEPGVFLPQPAKARMEKRGQYHVGVLDLATAYAE